MRDSSSQERAAVAIVVACVLLLTAYATVLFAQHEADRRAERRAVERTPAPAVVLTCPPSSPRAGRRVQAMSEC